MKWSWKRILLPLALILGVLALVTPPVMEEIKGAWFRSLAPERVIPEALAEVRARGISSDLNGILAAGAKPEGWKVTVVYDAVTPVWGNPAPSPQQPPAVILAASKPELVGRPVSEASPGVSLALGAWEKAPDGKEYEVRVLYGWEQQPFWNGFGPRVYAGPMLATLALAWVLLALWVYLDAREKGIAAAAGWLLLGLVTGPVGLAVWFIYGYTQGNFPGSGSRVCPGCGAEIPRSAAFCVRCGHAVKPACPECRKAVEVDWDYCAGCGRHLAG